MAEKVLMRDCGDGLRRADIGSFGKGTAAVAKTADYTIKASETGTVFSNGGATGAVIFTLPAPVFGLTFTFVKAVTDQNLVVKAPASVKINNGTAAQVYKNITSEMGTCTLVGLSSTDYMVLAEKGTWAGAAS